MSHCNTEGTNGWCNYYEEEIGGVEKKCESTRKEGAYTGKCLLNSGGGTVPVIIH
ncbi:hypothetical protein MM213_11040 [Belliella sp. R4-6]|uniref:Uncharacterized protein n=1 Tax=Belliella alkalica TaxID=1730871 RepID=A0ABS9VDK4_9BACT|nr:hypothetical protein [Belliella alkalica]MCH7414025.1 hypothetical protein [Belliella alkalica]